MGAICRHDYENALKEWKKAKKREKLFAILTIIILIFAPIEVLILFQLGASNKWPWASFLCSIFLTLFLLLTWLSKKRLKTKRKRYKKKLKNQKR